METRPSLPLLPEREHPSLPFQLVAAKLTPPFRRVGQVDRTRVLDRLLSDDGPPVVSVVAPAGYGKTTLLHQWADRSRRPCAWLSLDAGDDDPVVLLTYLAVALDRVAAIDPELFRLLAVEFPSVRAITRALGNSLAAWSSPGGLAVDDVHVLENPACHDILALLADHVPAGSQIALASRGALPLPVARLRAGGAIIEIGPGDLALDHTEASSLLSAAGVELAGADLRRLVDLTEGWPVAIYLAGRSLIAQGGSAPLDLANLGQSREIVSYAHAELLAALPPRTVEFLTRSSVLRRMTGGLCDAALRTFGSADRLEEMTESNLLVIPLDDHRGWYRYHHLFQDLLRGELERREPELVVQINRRAAVWCEDDGQLEAAVEFAMAGEDPERAARVLLLQVHGMYRAGQAATLGRWFEWFDDRAYMSRYPGVAAAGAWVAALTGQAAAAERWGEAAERGQLEYALTDGLPSVIEGQVALLRAVLRPSGPDQVLADARVAERMIPLESPWRPLTLVVLGLAHLLRGSSDHADGSFIEAVQVGREAHASPAVSVALAERALIALERGEISEAYALIDQASAVVVKSRLQDHVTNVIVFAAAARLALRGGNVARAEQLLTQAQRLRPRLTYALASLAVQARLELIRVMLSLADGPGARTILREVDDIMRVRPSLGVLVDEVNELRARIVETPVGRIGASSLTGAELRLLPLLQTHLTFREIGERLFISPHTVKTEALSIYRKLGVSSRSEAMRVAGRVGLLPS